MTTDEIESKLRWKTRVCTLTFSSDMASGSCDLTLTVAGDAPSDQVTVQFRGVANLQLKGFGGGLTQLLFLEITNISDRQWEHLCFEVREFEEDAISFLCRDIELLSS